MILISFGQIIFKVASNNLIFSYSILENIKFFKILFSGFIIYVIATILWVLCLKDASLSQIYPFAALAFIFVPIFEWLILGNSFNTNSLIGAFIILIGVYVATR
jgi:drug/metabolite transporter (DMT)-like permease